MKDTSKAKASCHFGPAAGARFFVTLLLVFITIFQTVVFAVPSDARPTESINIVPPPTQVTQAVGTRHRPILNSGTISGSLRLLTGENFNINGGISMTELLVPGTPTFTFNGGTHGPVISDNGSTSPAGYPIIINGGTIAGNIHKQADPIPFPTDIPTSVPNATGTRTVNINSANDVSTIGNWQTVATLNVNASGVTINVPPGNYTSITLNSASTLRFSAGIYNFSNTLTLNGNSRVESTGVVTINLKQSLNVNVGKFLLGSNTLAGDVRLNVLGTSVNVNGNCEIDAQLRASNGTVTLNGSSLIRGSIWANSFTLNGGQVTADICATNGTGCGITGPPSLTSVNPVRAVQGQTVQVTLQGTNTHWASGQTRASFGGEVSVGGDAEGDLGLINVTSANTATANLVVSSTGALAARSVRVVTTLSGGQTEDISLASAFAVVPVSPPGASQNKVTTIAGGAGTPGYSDGTSTSARFRDLAGIAVSADDTIYVADAGNNRIRMVRREPVANNSVDWVTRTVAGDGTAGFNDGAAASARFNNPQGVGVSPDGAILVADSGNNRIRRIASDGTVSTVAGGSVAGFADGSSSQARFNNPRGLAVDSLGNIYVADSGNSAVRRIDLSGNVVTLAGDGTIGSNDSPTAHFNGLAGIVVDGLSIYIYLADGGNNRIRRLDSSGSTITVAGSGRGFADGSASAARFAEPAGVAIDASGRLAVADTTNSLIRSVSPDAAAVGSPQAVITLAGAGERGSVDGTGNIARFNLPRAVAISQTSAVIVADTGNHTLRRIGIPPRISSFDPSSGRVMTSVNIYGENFDGRGTDKNTVYFAKTGGGQTAAVVSFASRTQLTVTVPSNAATGVITVTTGDGTATSGSTFTVQSNPTPQITDFNPGRGQVGTSVKLTGTALKADTGGDPLVTFAGSGTTRRPALVTSATETEVNVVVPNGAVTGKIELTNAWGVARTAQNFVVDESQTFEITVAPSSIQAIERTSGNSIVSINGANQSFTQLASLSASGLPPGVTAAFEPKQITGGGTSTLRLDLANAAISSGSFTFTVMGTAQIDGRDVVKQASATLNILPGGQTTLSGRVLNTDSEPVVGATVSLDGQTATTDASGGFLLSGIIEGDARPVQIDGRTASAPNRTYPVITEPANIIGGQANQVPYIFYLPPIDIDSEVTIVPGQTSVVRTPKVPDVSVTIPANAHLRNRDGSPVTRVSITALPIDRTPTPLPEDVTAGVVFTIQPGGALSDVPMPITFPNTLGTAPSTELPLYAFDHDTVHWYVFGYGRVSLDGKRVEPEIDPATGGPYGITNFSWFLVSDLGPGGNPRGGPGTGDGTCGSENRGTNPVDMSSGMKIESNTDIVFAGSNGGAALGRTYTSQLGASFVTSSFGLGTTSSYDFQAFVSSIQLDENGQEVGTAFLRTPEDVEFRTFSFAGRNVADGSLVFKSGQTLQFQGDVLVKETNGNVNFRRADGSTLNFVPDGQSSIGYRLDNITDRNGNSTRLIYSGSQLVQITDPVGRSIILTHTGNGSISSATDPEGRTFNYEYDSQNRLIHVTDPLSRKITYAYDDNNLMTEIRDSDGVAAKKITYSPQKRVVKEEFSDGKFESYLYEISGSLVTKVNVTSPEGRVISKRFNGNGYVVETVDPLGQVTIIERDAKNFPVRTTGASGCTESRTFDDRGNPATITDKLGQTVQVTYEPKFNNVTSVRDKLNRTTAMTYDTNGNLSTYKDAKNNILQNFYDSYGRIIEIRNSQNQSTYFEYDEHGNTSAIVDKTGARWTYEFDAIGNQTASIDPLGRRTTRIFDNANRITSVTDSSGAVTSFNYDSNSNLTKITNQLGRQWRMRYDTSNRLIETTDPLNRIATLTYNADGDLVSARSPSGRTVKYQYDARGQVLETIDPLGGKLDYAYDFRGNLLSIRDKRGFTTNFTYDLLDRLKSMRNPLGQSSSLQYNAASKISEAIDALGRSTTYAYDEIDRATTINYPDSQVNFTYDDLSRLTQVNDSQSGSIQWTFDARDMVTSETTANGTVSYSYNAAGQRESMSVPNTQPVNYFYDTAGRLQTIKQGTEEFNYGYDELSRLVSLSRPNGINTTFAYDIVSRMERMTHAGASGTLEDYQIAYDIDDQVQTITTLNSSHLVSAAKTASQPDGANRVAQFGNASYTFDARGQNTSKSDTQDSAQYNWDARGRLSGAALQSGTSVDYTYDALGRRASTSVNGVATKYLYDGLDVVQDQASNGNTDYVNGPGLDDKLRMRSQTTGDLYFLQDQIGSTQGLTNAAGSVVEWQRYTPYGESNIASSLTRYGYAGRERDQVTGLIFNRARWYDPSRSRFLSEDPKGFAAGSNFYEYAGGNPISRTDPLGLDFASSFRDFSASVSEARNRIEQRIIEKAAPVLEGVIGFGDNASGGLTRYLRQWQGQDIPGIECSLGYQIGGWTAVAVQVAEGGLGVYKLAGQYALRRGLAVAVEEGIEEAGALRSAKNCVLCFEAGTSVETIDGKKSIEEIKEGDQILSYNEQTGQNEYQAVTETFTRLADDVWSLKVRGQEEPLGVTSEHPFFVRSPHRARDNTAGGDESDGAWKETWQIQAGDLIKLADGRWARVISNLPKGGERRVYNFTVVDNHNYFVGNLRLLTHNCQIDLKYKSGWSPEQIAEADRKVAALQDAAESGDLVKTNPTRSATSASTRYRNAGNEIPTGSDVDHVRDLQLGGSDGIGNMSPLNSSVNRSLGTQVQNQIRNVPYGTRITGVRIAP